MRKLPSPVDRRRLGAGFAVAFTLAAGPAMADGAETVTRWYDELGKVDGFTVRHGAITDEADGKTVARDVEVSFKAEFKVGITDMIQPVAMTIAGTWSLPEFTATDLVDTAEGYRATSFEAPKQNLTLEATVAGAPGPMRITATTTDLVMRDGSWPRLPELADDPARPVSRFGPLIEAALTQSWAEQTMALTEVTLETPGTKQVSRYGPSRVTGFVDGRIAEVTSENSKSTSTVTTPGQDGAPPTTVESLYSIRRTVDTGYDLLPVVRAVFGLPQAAPRSIVLESGVIEGVVSEGGGGKIDIARSTTRGISIGTPAVPLSALYDRLVLEGTVPADELANSFLALIEVLGGSEIEVSDITFDGLADAAGGTAIDVEGGIREVRLAGWNGLSVDSVSVAGITGDLPDAGGLTLDRFALTDFAYPSRESIVDAVRVGMAAAAAQKKAAAEPKPEAAPSDDGADPDIDGTDMDGTDDAADMDGSGSDDLGTGDTAGAVVPSLTTRQIMNLVPTLGGFEVSGLSVTQGGERVVGLDSFRGVFENFVAPIPTDVRLDLAGLRIPAKYVDDADMSDALARFGITTLDADMTLALDWDEATGAYALEPFEVAVAGMGTHTTRVRLGGVPRSVFADPENAQAALPQMTFEGAETRLSDAPALSTYIASLARDAGVSADALIDGYVSQVRQMIAAQAGDALADQAASAVRSFLDDPAGFLSVKAEPKAPVPLAALMGSAMMAPGSLVGLLNVSFEAGKPR